MQVTITVIIIVGVLGVCLIEYFIKRLEPALTNLNVNVAPTSTQPTISELAEEFAGVRAQIEKTNGTPAAEAFVADYCNCIFKSASK